MTPAQVADEVLRAESRIRPHVVETPALPCDWLSRETGTSVWLKYENQQHTGSFKVRGALNRLLAMSPAERERGVVAASTGNHGAAVAYSLGRLEAHGLIFVPEGASPSKLETIEKLGGEVRVHGTDSGETETHARRFADEQGMTYLSPYNDPLVVGGQGTIGVELERQLDDFDVVVGSLGGGGLIAGIAGYLKRRRPDTLFVAVSPVNSPVMIRSLEAGRVLELESEPTLSDGTAGGVEPDAITFELCQALIDESVTVTEDEIRDALSTFLRREPSVIEGSAAVALAALRQRADAWSGKRVAVVLCGGNIDPALVEELT